MLSSDARSALAFNGLLLRVRDSSVPCGSEKVAWRIKERTAKSETAISNAQQLLARKVRRQP